MARKNQRERDAIKREILEQLFAQKRPDQIQDMLSLPADEFESYFTEILEGLAKQVANQPVEHVYAHYMIDITAIINKLGEIVSSPKTHPRDAVAALRAQFEARDKMLGRARELNIVQPISVDGGGSLGVNMTWISGLSSEDLKKALYQMLQEFRKIDHTLQEAGFLDAPIGEIFSGPSIKELGEAS